MSTVTPAQLRRFGLVVGGVFVLLGGWSWWRGHSVVPGVLWTVGCPLMVCGCLAPQLLAPVERRWMAFAHVLGRINTTVILSLLYFLMFAPIGFLPYAASNAVGLAKAERVPPSAKLSGPVSGRR